MKRIITFLLMLLWEALKHDKHGYVEKAIKDGILNWQVNTDYHIL